MMKSGSVNKIDIFGGVVCGAIIFIGHVLISKYSTWPKASAILFIEILLICGLLISINIIKKRKGLTSGKSIHNKYSILIGLYIISINIFIAAHAVVLLSLSDKIPHIDLWLILEISSWILISISYLFLLKILYRLEKQVDNLLDINNSCD